MPDAKLILGILAREPERVLPDLELRFGLIDRATPAVPFRWSDYYEREMGAGLRRKFVSFARPVEQGELAAIKRWTMGFEGPKPRPVNLDPGYVTPAKLVLATTKDRGHRVYLADGIFAEATLAWAKNTFVPFEWTYPDYRDHIDFFNAVRRCIQSDTARGLPSGPETA
jgi:hypothetical protein